MPRNVKSVQYKIWTLVTSKPFDTFILCLIALNTVVLMTQVRPLKITITAFYLIFCNVQKLALINLGQIGKREIIAMHVGLIAR